MYALASPRSLDITVLQNPTSGTTQSGVDGRWQSVLSPIPARGLLDLGELWQYRHLFAVLVWRTIKLRYRQTAVGVAWAILQPLLLTILLTVVFGILARIPTDGQPYPLFVVSGLLVWLFVAQSVQAASLSVVQNSHLVTRIYFPRILLPLVAITSALIDFLCVLGLVAGMMIWYGSTPTLGVLAFFPTMLIAVATVLGISLWAGALYVPFRDVGHLLPFGVQLWMFLSPIIYPATLLPERYEILYSLNPLVVVMETSRWAFSGGKPPQLWMVALAATIAAALLASGLRFFRRREGTFADIV